MPAGGLVIAGGIGLAKAAMGFISAGKAKRKAEELAKTRPQYTESPYYKDALKLSESELSTGMSGEAKNAYEQGIDRDLSTSLSTILKGGGSVNNVAQVFDASAQGRQRLALMKENLRLNQINNVVRAEQLNSEEREKAFQFNQWAPWADAAKATGEARTAAQGEIWSGINTIGSAAMGFASSQAGKTQLGGLLQGGSGNAASGSNNPTGPVAQNPPAGQSWNGDQAPPLADTSGGRPNTASLSPAFISPNIAPVDFSQQQSSNYTVPDMSHISNLE